MGGGALTPRALQVLGKHFYSTDSPTRVGDVRTARVHQHIGELDGNANLPKEVTLPPFLCQQAEILFMWAFKWIFINEF